MLYENMIEFFRQQHKQRPSHTTMSSRGSISNRSRSFKATPEEQKEIQFLTHTIGEMEQELNNSKKRIKELNDILEVKISDGEIFIDQHGGKSKFMSATREKELRGKAKETEESCAQVNNQVDRLKENNEEQLRKIKYLKEQTKKERKERDNFKDSVIELKIREEKMIEDYDIKIQAKDRKIVEKTQEIQLLGEKEKLLKEKIAKTIARIKNATKALWK